MKILYATFYDARFRMGGAEQVVFDLASGMKASYGDDVACLVNPGDLAEKFRENKIRVEEVPWSKIKTPEIVQKTKKIIADFSPDIIHSHHRYFTFLLDFFFKKKIRLIHTEEVLRKDKKELFRYGHFAVACHESVEKNLIEHYGIPKERVKTILNAVSKPVANPEILGEIRRRYEKTPGQVIGLCIARFDEQKGHRHLVEAVSKIEPESRKRFKIFLAGDGPLLTSVKNQVNDLGLAENFVFLGYCSQLPEFLEFCDFTVLSSLWEGSPLTILLSFAAGKPLLATDIDGIRDQIKPGETGCLVPAKDPKAMGKAFEQWIKNPAPLKKMGEQAYAWWRAHSSLEASVSAYRLLYQEVIDQKKESCKSKFL